MLLIDTNIISELSRRQPDPAVLAWASDISGFCISVVSLEEIPLGLAWRPNPRVSAWLDGFFSRHTALPITADIARRVGDLRGHLATRGSPRTQADLLIAATALTHALTPGHSQPGDFENCAVALLNPFTN